MKIKLNADLLKHKSGDIIEIPSKDGVPKDVYWRNRLKDSEIDGCIEIVKKTQKKDVDNKR